MKCFCVSNNCYGRYLKSSRMFQFFYCSSESSNWSCVSKNCYGRYLKSSTGCFRLFYYSSKFLKCSCVSKKSLRWVVDLRSYLSGLQVFIRSFTGFLEIVPVGNPWRIPSCQNRSGRFLNLSIGCSRFSKKLFRLVLEVLQGCLQFIKIILACFKLIRSVLAFFKSLRWVLEDHGLSNESNLVSTNIIRIFALFQMSRLLRDSGTSGKKIEAGYHCTGWNIRIDISSHPKGLRFHHHGSHTVDPPNPSSHDQR